MKRSEMVKIIAEYLKDTWPEISILGFQMHADFILEDIEKAGMKPPTHSVEFLGTDNKMHRTFQRGWEPE